MDCLSDAVNRCYGYERWLSKLRESQDRQGQGFILLNILIFCSSWRSFSFFALIFLFFFCSFFRGGAHYEAHGILVPIQGLNLCPLYWKGRILTTGPRVGSPFCCGCFCCVTGTLDLSSPAVPIAAEVQSSNHRTARKFPALIKEKMHEAVLS